jgi:hypothetical protein
MARKPALGLLLLSVPVLAAALSSRPPLAAADKPNQEELVEQVRKAIDRGVQFLRDQQKGGNWETTDQSSVSHQGGWTSLALLAMLNAGVKPDDPAVQSGLEYLRGVDSGQTYVVSLQTMVFAEVGDSKDAQRIQRNVDWLIRAMLKGGKGSRGWTYVSTGGRGDPDNSNTQYALLGLHAGHLAGAHIDRKTWTAIQQYYLDTQHPDGGWSYNGRQTPATLTMSTAGVCGLLISGMELNPSRETILGTIKEGNVRAEGCGRYDDNNKLARGLAWVSHPDNFRFQLPINSYYNVYGIERVGRLSGQRFLGEFDWYRTGCKFLVAKQHDDGSWYEHTQFDDWPIVSTSFALLFLSKGRTPILISKLVHGPGGDWNNDRNDARHLTEYASREVFRKLPLGWQIFDIRHQDTGTDARIRELTRELLQSPIVYFNGHEAPEFTGAEIKLLREYVEQGGFILAEACCSRPEFDRGFRELVKQIFPNSETTLKELDANHPIWSAHASVPPGSFKLEGVDYGCKTVLIYSPVDFSCLWEANKDDKGDGQLAFRLAGNIVAYATGMEPPKPRLTRMELIVDDADEAKIPRGYLKVAQVEHEGDWQPAPNAMRNLMGHLREKRGLDVALKTKAIKPTATNLTDYKFLYMHGRKEFTLSAVAVQNLRTNLETGAVLFADACCGKKAFDQSFRDLAAKLFPDKKLEVIPVSDDLFRSEDLNGTPIKTVRCRREVAGGDQTGDFREVAPYLEGIKYQNRWVVIYSKYDIGCALERHQSPDCLGHDHDSALRLGTAAVMYALKR